MKSCFGDFLQKFDFVLSMTKKSFDAIFLMKVLFELWHQLVKENNRLLLLRKMKVNFKFSPAPQLSLMWVVFQEFFCSTRSEQLICQIFMAFACSCSDGEIYSNSSLQKKRVEDRPLQTDLLQPFWDIFATFLSLRPDLNYNPRKNGWMDQTSG